METDIEQQLAESPPERSRFINPNFVRLWIAGSLSSLGDTIFELTLTVWIATELAEGRDWSALAVTGLLIASAISILCIGPIAGALIDRWTDKRRVMQRADLISAALVLALIPLAGIVSIPGIPQPLLWWRLGIIFTIVLLASAVAQFLRPAAWVMVRDVVPEADLARSSSLFQASFNLIVLIGPALATPILFTLGPVWALLFNGISFVASYCLVRSMNYITPQAAVRDEQAVNPGGLFGEIGEGFRFFMRSPVLTTLGISFSVCMIGMGAMNTLDIFFVQENLSVDPENYGFLVSIMGGTMVVGALLWGKFIERFGAEKSIWVGLIALGFLTIIYARLTSFTAALVANVAFGLVIPSINVAIGPILYRVTPREFMGRVNATIGPLMSGSTMIGLFGGGLLYSTVMRDFDAAIAGIHFGPIDTIFIGTGILCLIGGVNAMRMRLPDVAVE
ncbi:MFS transporter [soil metagenome]